MRQVLILGVETSCDETAAAVVADGEIMLSNIIASQIEEHRKYGGVVPEIASRKHLEIVNEVLEKALLEAGVCFSDITAIAVTHGPGLVGALLVGVNAAKTLGYALGKPVIAVNHLLSHVAANYLVHRVPFPAVCLVVSGGHTSLLHLNSRSDASLLGSSRDDAAGEAFDKIARILGLGYPGGPAVEQAAADGDSRTFQFPRAFAKQDHILEFSFSGLKSAVINTLNALKKQGKEYRTEDVAASFQHAVVEILVEKTILAARMTRARTVLLAGGVAANSLLRRLLSEALQAEGCVLLNPPPVLCTDNAAMVAAAGFDLYVQQRFAGLDLNATPVLDRNWHLG
ncbi:MAG: tRNA (adenosine(37)-N6)-threonylcarbamoyltransferase complex transferase subunit TsaD [Dethiobacter sp.]|nr:tRNA (adenosine(37)-N6)-threonylcarbamoyltransferase complex transferase subunit TsaD [Dethiobacter sp.]MBS3897566.1 tRNA (adenosine(37)-N6)-threonylcarbamoyltransferase complex transferase subunit TsaD [Dethiobacter sp.]MBS3983158.1 tRNA (adenosine(37)-N6)-threonylcarbamoyltransferase complex transferase subunit TsaD [Dethiobacter sp.]MCL4463804.1 tRNA (adenosine(37)-N6)-threonylcarbamoyltransferase complex transferase subunit TsaD [Bacillota bacterium]MCL5993423.1 tRNA (adenosine(37)-N6)-t